LVEHLHGKEGVPGSSPGVGLASESRFSKRFQAVVRVPGRAVGHRKCPYNTGSKHPQVPPGTAARSKAIWEKFRDETLLPAFQAGQSVLPGPPKTTEFEIEVEL
jgi:hypothetical protein